MRQWVYDVQDTAIAWLPAGFRLFLAIILALASYPTPEPYNMVILIAAVAALTLRSTKTQKSKGD